MKRSTVSNLHIWRVWVGHGELPWEGVDFTRRNGQFQRKSYVWKVLFPFNFVPSAFFLRLLSNLTLNAPYKMESLSFLYNDSVLKFVEDVSS